MGPERAAHQSDERVGRRCCGAVRAGARWAERQGDRPVGDRDPGGGGVTVLPPRAGLDPRPLSSVWPGGYIASVGMQPVHPPRPGACHGLGDDRGRRDRGRAGERPRPVRRVARHRKRVGRPRADRRVHVPERRDVRTSALHDQQGPVGSRRLVGSGRCVSVPGCSATTSRHASEQSGVPQREARRSARSASTSESSRGSSEPGTTWRAQASSRSANTGLRASTGPCR